MAAGGRYAPVAVKVSGPYACFTRPEMKVERVSYDVMTPSAARGILESIFWKPEFHWHVREIRVLRDIRYFSLRRNEVTHRASYRAVRGWVEGGDGGGYYANEDRAQRHTLGLRDVAYIILADVAVRTDVAEDSAKYRDQFRRRVARGQSHTMSYLGCREFTANVEEPDGTERPIDVTQDLGRMLFDLDYLADGSGRGTPRFFAATLVSGVLRVPPDLYVQKV